MVPLSQCIPLPFTAIKVETLAARRALELAMETSCDRVILEGNLQILITALKDDSYSLSHFGHCKRYTVPCLLFFNVKIILMYISIVIL